MIYHLAALGIYLLTMIQMLHTKVTAQQHPSLRSGAANFETVNGRILH